VDVASYYPGLMILYKLLSRNVRKPEKFREIRDKRLELKKAKDKRQGCLKIVINGTFGITKDKYNNCYDPRQANMICINGQLLLLDLIEKMEEIKSFELVQSNTDGLIVIVDKEDDAKLMEVCKEWETRTGLELEKDRIEKLFQKDVNNYIAVFENGDIDRKGAWVKKNSPLDNDCPILNECLYNYFVHDKKVEDTINEHDELIAYQKVVRISSKYKYGWHNNKRIENEKTFRVFASKSESDGFIGKQKHEEATIEKFGNTPDHCFIDNGNIKNKRCPAKLDKQYYIDVAKERIEQFC
jgi:DNA polymerase elongation subunit (family B)